MAKYAPIAAPQYLRMLKAAGLLGNYHLILAHDVVANPELYRDLFSPNDFIIMDNSLIELGHPVDTATMLKACEFIMPTCVVLPDHLENTEKTLEATMQAGEEWKAAGIEALTFNGFMAVPQGKTYDKITGCYDILKEWSEHTGVAINYWGIPKAYGERNKSRMPVIEYIAGASVAPPQNMHLLGFSHNLSDDIKCAQHDCVKGIDSAVPIRLGMHGVGLSMATKKHAPRGAFFEQSAKETMINRLVAANLNYVRHMIQ